MSSQVKCLIPISQRAAKAVRAKTLPFVRQPRGDTKVTPEDKQRLAEQRAAEIAKVGADFNVTTQAHLKFLLELFWLLFDLWGLDT